MRVMSYNIWFGGGRPLPGSGNRRTQIRDIVRAASPDIVTFLECNDWVEDGGKILRAYQTALGMKGHLLATKPDPVGNAFNIAVMARPDLVVRQVIMDATRFWHGVVAIELMANDGEPVRFVATHLCPLSPEERLEEIRTILRHFCVKGRTVLMGDLNSLSPHDHYRVSAIPKAQADRHVKGGKVDTSVIEALEEAGMVDALLHLHPRPGNAGFTAPTPCSVDPAFQDTQLRLDYFFVSQELVGCLRSGEVIRNEETNSASDHFPILLELDL